MKTLLGHPRHWSMQAQLIVIAIAIILLAWIAGVAVMARTAAREAAVLHDRELQQVARLLLGLAGQELDEMGPNSSVALRIANTQGDTHEILGEDYRYQIWSGEGHLLLSNFGLPSAAAMAKLGVTGFSQLQMDGEEWRVYALHDVQAAKEIHVAERVALRRWSLTKVDTSLFSLVVLSIVIVIVPALWLLRRQLRPLRELADVLRQRSPINLEAVRLRHVPAELAPVVSSVNALFGRVSEAIQRERGFTAVAAHELRTPLATLRVLAETAAGTEDQREREKLLQDLKRSVDRCAHLQEQLLTMARLDVIEQSQLNAEFDLAGVIIDAQADLLMEARRRHITLAARVDETTINAHRFGVQTLLRNLLSNSVRYTPQGGRVEISTRTEGSNAIIEVNDSGPGIPDADRVRVFERFERLNREQESGVGLGLSIVRAVADTHGAQVTLGQSTLGGLRVVVTFQGRAVSRPRGPEVESSAFGIADGGALAASTGSVSRY